MNRKRALEILEIQENDLSESGYDIKREYRKKILQFHPDKNKAPDASAKFLEIQEAYAFLQQDDAATKEESYDDMMNSFLFSVFKDEVTTPLVAKIIEIICKKICPLIEHSADHIIEYLRTINRDTLRMIRGVLSKYWATLHLSSDLLEKIDEILLADECIVLNPLLEDLLSDENVYILKREDRSYLVPLWHHEMAFDHSGNGFMVKCFPVLPDNMELDECNVLTVRLQYYLSELWDREAVVVIGGKPFVISGRDLKMTGEPQRIEYLDCGLPYNNADDILDVSRKQSVVFIVTVEGDK